jgi:hypothetical protein
LPWDRGSAESTYELRVEAGEDHYITGNKRFSIIGSGSDAIVLRESDTADGQGGVEGSVSTVKVEVLKRGSVKFSFEEPGERGETVDRVYEVTKYGCCRAANTYSYFSLLDGTKLLSSSHSKLSQQELYSLLSQLQQ